MSGGLIEGVGKPVLMANEVSFIEDEFASWQRSRFRNCSSQAEKSRGVCSSKEIRLVQSFDTQFRLLDSSETCVDAGEGIATEPMLTFHGVDLESPSLESGSGRFLRFPTTLPTMDWL